MSVEKPISFRRETLVQRHPVGESKECLSAWKQLYKAVVLETNMEPFPRRVQEARKAAGEHAMHLIREPADDDLELQDLVYASRVLDELNRTN
jgi:hypothetical protein